MPTDIQRETDAVGDHQQLDVAIDDRRHSKMGVMHWIAVVGVGTVVLPVTLNFLMKQNAALVEKVVIQNAESAVAMTKAAESMDDVADSVDDMVEDSQGFRAEFTANQERLTKDLAPLIRQLDRVADAVEAAQEAPAEGP